MNVPKSYAHMVALQSDKLNWIRLIMRLIFPANRAMLLIRFGVFGVCVRLCGWSTATIVIIVTHTPESGTSSECDDH